jgi:hypothetical protein
MCVEWLNIAPTQILNEIEELVILKPDIFGFTHHRTHDILTQNEIEEFLMFQLE